MGTKRAVTGLRPIYGLTADKVTDASGKQFEVINIRLDHEGIPVTINIDLPEIGTLDTDTAEAKEAGLDEAPEAGGFACYQHIFHAVEDSADSDGKSSEDSIGSTMAACRSGTLIHLQPHPLCRRPMRQPTARLIHPLTPRLTPRLTPPKRIFVPPTYTFKIDHLSILVGRMNKNDAK